MTQNRARAHNDVNLAYVHHAHAFITLNSRTPLSAHTDCLILGLSATLRAAPGVQPLPLQWDGPASFFIGLGPRAEAEIEVLDASAVLTVYGLIKVLMQLRCLVCMPRVLWGANACYLNGSVCLHFLFCFSR